MDERKLKILQAIIDDYIMTAVPVGSRTISKKYDMGLSPATIRNEMSDLEDLGYLAQPHVSAGRVPSPKAYRFYVDKLLENEKAEQQKEQNQLAPRPGIKRQQIEGVIDNACKTLAAMTGYTAVVLQPVALEPKLQTLQLVSISKGSALAVLITENATVKTSVVQVCDNLSSDELYAISKFLTGQFKQMSISGVIRRISSMAETVEEHGELLRGIRDFLRDCTQGVNKAHVAVEGISNILNYPEFSDVDKAHSFMEFMENENKVISLVSTTAGEGTFHVRIGKEETGVKEMDGLSLVTTTYRIWSGMTGTLGIIGPQRMQYPHVFSVLNVAGKQLSDVLTRTN